MHRFARCFTPLALAGVLLATGAAQARTCTVASHPWLPWAPAVYGAEKGVFKAQGLDLKPVYYADYNEMVDAVAAGKVDFAFAMLGDAVKARAEGKPIKVLAEVDWSNGGDKILIRSSFKNLADLKGKRVAADQGTVSYYFLLQSLAKFGLKESDITIVPMDAEAAADAIGNGEVDGAVTWEPDASEAVDTGKAKVGFTTRQLPGVMPEVIVVREELLKTGEKAAVAFLKGWLPSVAAAMKDKAGFLKSVNANGLQDFPLADVKELEDGLGDVSIHDAKTLQQRNNGPAQEYAKAYMAYLVQQKAVAKPVNTDALFSVKVLKDALGK